MSTTRVKTGILITGLWVRTEIRETETPGVRLMDCVVLIEKDGQWVEVSRDLLGAQSDGWQMVSHIIEPAGMKGKPHVG